MNAGWKLFSFLKHKTGLMGFDCLKKEQTICRKLYIKCSYAKTTVTKSDESAYRSKRDTLYSAHIF
jgi:hypothetical protein